MHDYFRLEVWNKSRTLVKDIYQITSQFPNEEIYSLTSQIKRSSISIPSNIAEGCGRGSNNQLKYHLEVALGSSFELSTQVLLAYDLQYISEKEKTILINKIDEVSKMINGLIKSLRPKV
jgi:four helix bundle protein